MHSVGPFGFKKPVWSPAGLLWPIRIWSLVDLANNYIVQHRSLTWKGVQTFHTLHILGQTSFSCTDLLTWYCVTAQMVIAHQNWFCRTTSHEKISRKWSGMESREAGAGQVLASVGPNMMLCLNKFPQNVFHWVVRHRATLLQLNKWMKRLGIIPFMLYS